MAFGVVVEGNRWWRENAIRISGVLGVLPQTHVQNESSGEIDYSIDSDTIFDVPNVDNILEKMRSHPTNIRFSDLCRVCDHHFGAARQSEVVTEFIRLRGEVTHE